MANPSRALVLASLALTLAPLLASAPAEAQSNNPPLPIKEAAVTRWVFGRNGSIANDAIACRAQAGACVPGSRHLAFVPPVALPAMTGCSNGTTALMTCYAGAVERTQQALEEGSVWKLYEAAERTRVVTNRANASATAPAWMKSASANNLLYKFFTGQGLPMTTAFPCVTGTEAQRYQCMGATGGPTAAVHRAAINLLDHHNDVRVNWSQTAGARQRLENLVRSATAPAVSAMTTRGKLDPTVGPGLPRMDLLGKLVYLRRLTNEAGTIDAEIAYLDALTAYRVSATSPRVGVELALFAAARKAYWTDPATRHELVVDAAIAGELGELFANVDHAMGLELIRGDVAGAYDAGRTIGYLARARTAQPLDAYGLIARYDELHLYELESFNLGWVDGQDHCDWFTVEDIMIGLTAIWPVTETHQIWVADCLPAFGNDCDPEDGHWETWTTTTWVTGPTVWKKIGEDIIAESIRHNYKLLLDADDLDEDGDPDFVDVDGNGAPDHDLESDSAVIDNATIARTGISAEECLDELEVVSGGYGHELGATDLDCDTTGNAHCKGEYGGTDGHMFLPYAMASHLCPMYTKRAIGIDAVTLTNGEIGSVSLSCPTAYEYVARVAETLEVAPSEYLEAIDEKRGAIGALLGYFNAEAGLLSWPAAGTLRQRADLAYFSAEPMGECGDTPTGECVGLDVLEERLDLAADAVLKGLALYRQFSRIDRSEVGLDGDDDIAHFAAESVEVCRTCSGSCLECLSNSTDQLHALTYRRMRDALGVYQSLRSDQLEVLWRRLDGMSPSCIAGADTDGDSVIDASTCNVADAACAAFCPAWEEAHQLGDDVAADMASVVDDLGDQLEEVEGSGASPDLATFIGDIGGWADGITVGAQSDLRAIDTGVTWLGTRKGRWAVASSAGGGDLTEQIEADLAFLEVEADELAGEYDGWVSEYLSDLTIETNWVQSVEQTRLAVQDDIASYCQDLAGNPAPDGCGVGVALGTNNPTADALNAVIEDQFCKVAVEEFPTIAVDIADPSSPYYLDPGDAYLDWVASVGLTDCPRLVAPDVAALTASYGGSLITVNVLAIERARLDLEAAIKDFHAYVLYMQSADELFTMYEDAVAQYERQQATKKWLGDILVCGAAYLGAAAGSIGTGGTVAVLLAAGATATCAARFVEDSGYLFPEDGNISADELNFEAAYINQQVAQAEQLYAATQKIEAVLLRMADYQAAVLTYQSELATFQRTVAYGNTTLDTLGAYAPFMDPTALLLEQDQLTSLRARFKVFAAELDLAHRTIEYDISNIVPVGGAYARTVGESYWMPRLADITVASAAGADGATAYTRLTMNGGVAPPPEDQSLVATASLLTRIYADFRETYGDRLDYGETAYIGSATPGFVDADANGLQDVVNGELQFGNVGERAMLGDSRFYDPSGPTASGCRVGRVDVSDYCHAFANSVTRVPAAGNCADIRTMPLGERLDLAHLAHMARSPGVETFSCTVDERGTADVADDVYTIAARVGSGTGGAFTGSDLPFHTNVGPWHRDAADTVDEVYFLAQTPEVRALIDHYIDGVLDERHALSTNAKFYPGSYVYGIDMVDAGFEPEADLLAAAPFAAQTQSEQIDAVAVICTSATACGADSIAAEDHRPVDFILFGPGYKGTRCRYSDEPVTLTDGTVSDFATQSGLRYLDGTSRQAQLEFEMDDDLSSGNVKTIKTTAPESQALIDQVLDDSTLLQRPLHASRMIVSVYGLYDAAGAAAGPNETWSLHRGADVNPRLRIAVRYSHYNTDPIVGAQAIAIDEFLACPANSERM